MQALSMYIKTLKRLFLLQGHPYLTEHFLNLLKSNEPNSISKDALRDEECPWLINCTTEEYLVNVGQDSHFNMPSHLWRTNQNT